MNKLYLLIALSVVLLLSFGCVHKTVEEPDVTGNPGINLVMEGNATPSVLYIPKTLIPQITTITVKVTAANMVPVPGREVLFQQVEANQLTMAPADGCTWGYFGSGLDFSIKKQLDSNGTAQVTFRIPGLYTVPVDTLMYIKVTLMNIDNNRVEMFDYIPLFLKVYVN